MTGVRAAGTREPDGLGELVARRDRLRVELAELVEQRQAAEQVAQRMPALQRAIAVICREGDGGSSAVLRRHRETFERLMGDIEDTQLLVARVQTRLARYGDPAEGHRARQGEAVCRRAVRAMAAIGAALESRTAHDTIDPDGAGRAENPGDADRCSGAGARAVAGEVAR